LDRIRRLAARPRHLTAADQRALAAAAPQGAYRRQITQTTYERIRAAMKPRAHAQWHTFGSAGGRMFLYLLGLPTEEENPITRVPWAVWFLILMNAWIWLIQYFYVGVDESCARFGMIPSAVLSGDAPMWTVLSGMFLHGSWMHILGNMYFL